MVKYAFMLDMKFDNENDKNQIKTIVSQFMNKKLWGKKSITDINDIDNNQSLNIDLKFEKKEDMDDMFNSIKEKISKIKPLKGSKISIHMCHHDVVPFRPCEIIEEYVIGNVHRQVGD